MIGIRVGPLPLNSTPKIPQRRSPTEDATNGQVDYKQDSPWILKEYIVELFALTMLPFAAIGYSLVYLLGGGGIGGAIVIFIVAKMLGD
jgi:hypothetical protein